MSDRLSGSCLCGACAFTAEPEDDAGVCHCGMCRKWSGGMFMAVGCGDTLEFAPGAPVEAFKSSEWGKRLFCRICGAPLAWQSADGGHSAVSIQAFEDPGRFAIASEIFYDEKPGNYALAGDTHKMTGAEVIALYAPQSEGEGV